jgi:hypothetical protein
LSSGRVTAYPDRTGLVGGNVRICDDTPGTRNSGPLCLDERIDLFAAIEGLIRHVSTVLIALTRFDDQMKGRLVGAINPPVGW